MESYIAGPLPCKHLCNTTLITTTLITRGENYMNKLNVPNSFEECKTIEEAIAFYMANGYSEYEAYEMVKQILRPHAK